MARTLLDLARQVMGLLPSTSVDYSPGVQTPLGTPLVLGGSEASDTVIKSSISGAETRFETNSGIVNANGNRWKNTADPFDPQDAATKGYVGKYEFRGATPGSTSGESVELTDFNPGLEGNLLTLADGYAYKLKVSCSMDGYIAGSLFSKTFEQTILVRCISGAATVLTVGASEDLNPDSATATWTYAVTAGDALNIHQTITTGGTTAKAQATASVYLMSKNPIPAPSVVELFFNSPGTYTINRPDGFPDSAVVTADVVGAGGGGGAADEPNNFAAGGGGGGGWTQYGDAAGNIAWPLTLVVGNGGSPGETPGGGEASDGEPSTVSDTGSLLATASGGHHGLDGSAGGEGAGGAGGAGNQNSGSDGTQGAGPNSGPGGPGGYVPDGSLGAGGGGGEVGAIPGEPGAGGFGKFRCEVI